MDGPGIDEAKGGGSAMRRKTALLLCVLILPLLTIGTMAAGIDSRTMTAPPPDGLGRAERATQLMIMPVETTPRQLSWQRFVMGFGALLRAGMLAMLGLLGLALIKRGEGPLAMGSRLIATYHSIHAPPMVR